MTYPSKKDTVEILLHAAESAAYDTDVEHPEDIATHMTTALEIAHVVIMECHRRWDKPNNLIRADNIQAGRVTYEDLNKYTV